MVQDFVHQQYHGISSIVAGCDATTGKSSFASRSGAGGSWIFSVEPPRDLVTTKIGEGRNAVKTKTFNLEKTVSMKDFVCRFGQYV